MVAVRDNHAFVKARCTLNTLFPLIKSTIGPVHLTTSSLAKRVEVTTSGTAIIFDIAHVKRSTDAD